MRHIRLPLGTVEWDRGAEDRRCIVGRFAPVNAQEDRVLTVCCSTRLLKQVGLERVDPGDTPESRLGDWYATVLQLRPNPVVLLVSEPTRLAVLMPTRDFGPPGTKIAEAILRVLADLRVGAEALEHERLAMSVVAFARPASRGVTASTNALTLHLERLREIQYRIDDRTASARLGQVVLDIPGHGRRTPADVARELMAAGRA